MANIAQVRDVLKRELLRGPGVLSERLSQAEVEASCQAVGHIWRNRRWGPFRTLWTFLLQVLHAGSSCRSAVAMVLGELAAQKLAGQALCPGRCGGGKSDSGDKPLAGRKRPSGDPTAYCQARKRLPLSVLIDGLRHVGQQLQQQVDKSHLWLGRRVWLVDGTTCSMPDTPDLQKAFGQPTGQAKGCGFPVAKVVAMFCWASGAVLQAAIGPYCKHELPLWRQLWDLLSPGDILLGDRLYCTFADIVGLTRRGCDCIVRLHQRRPKDFRHGKRLGKYDRLVVWHRPMRHARPRGMGVLEWKRLPETLIVRMLRFTTDVPGFRSRRICIATTLLDPVAYPAEKIAELYRDRWLIELHFRNIKSKLGMDVLRGESADVVRKEILMHLLAYNLIRSLMWQAAAKHGKDLHRLSFAGTLDRLNALAPYLWLLAGTAKANLLLDVLLYWIAHDTVPLRPNRIEPRAVKRRPKQYDLLNKPRHQLRKNLLRQAHLS
jgi:hypothetical protein